MQEVIVAASSYLRSHNMYMSLDKPAVQTHETACQSGRSNRKLLRAHLQAVEATTSLQAVQQVSVPGCGSHSKITHSVRGTAVCVAGDADVAILTRLQQHLWSDVAAQCAAGA